MVTVVGQAAPAATSRVVVGKPVVIGSPARNTALDELTEQPSDERNDDADDGILRDDVDQPREDEHSSGACVSCFGPTASVEEEMAQQPEKATSDKENEAISTAEEGNGDKKPPGPTSTTEEEDVSPLISSIKKASEPTLFERMFDCMSDQTTATDPIAGDEDESEPEVDMRFQGGDLDIASLPTEDVVAPEGGFDAALAGCSPTEGNGASIVESKARAIRLPLAPDAPEGENMAMNGISNISNASADTRRNLLVKELKYAMANYGRYDVRCANISASLGDLLDENGQHEQAVKLHKDCVTIYSCKLGDHDPTTLNAKLQLGRVLEHNGDYNEAIEAYYAVTAMRRALEGEDHPSVADGFVHLARGLKLKKEYHEAIKELKRALRIYRESLGDSHEKVSSTVDEIASLYVIVGDFQKSSAILEEVVKLKAATYGADDTKVAATLVTLANSQECSGELMKAMKSLKKAYKIYTETEGYSSEPATNTLNRMAQLYEALDDHNRASIAYLGVLRGRKIHHGEDQLVVAETYYKLGRALHETGQIEKALKCMKEALPIYVKKSTEVADVETVAEIMHEMALINKEKKSYVDAARILKQELDVRRKIGQPDYPIIARNLNHLGVAEYELSNHTRALKCFVEALAIFQNKGEDSLDCAEVLFNTGLVFEAVKNKERALEAYSEAVRIFKENGYEEDHPHLSRAEHKVEKLTRPPEQKGSTSIMKRLFR